MTTTDPAQITLEDPRLRAIRGDLLADQSPPQEPQKPPEPQRSPMLDAISADLDRMSKAIDQQMAANFAQAVKADPDLAGEAQRIGLDINANPLMLERDIDKVREAYRRRNLELAKRAQGDSTLMRMYLDPAFARIAADDTENLTFLQKLHDYTASGRLTMLRGKLAQRLREGDDTPGLLAELTEVEQQLAKLPQTTADDGPFGLLYGLARQLGQYGDMLPRAMTTSLGMGAAAGAAGFYLPTPEKPWTVPSAMTVGFVGSLITQTFEVEAGGNYRDLIKMGVDPRTAYLASGGVGVVNAALEMIGGAAFTAPIRGAFKKQIAAAIAKDLIEQPTITKGALKFAARYALATGGEVVTEALQEVSNVVAEELSVTDWNKVDPDMVPPPFAERIANIIGETLRGVALLGLPGPLIAMHADAKRVARAKATEKFLGQLNQGITDSKVVERNPDYMERFLAAVSQGTPVETLYFTAEDFARTMQSAGVNRQQLAQMAPEVAKQLDASAMTGVVELPTATYGAKFLSGDLGKQLMQHAMIEPDGITAAQAAAITSEQRSQVKAQAEKILTEAQKVNKQLVEEARQVEMEQRQTLRDLGYTTEEATLAAKAYKNFVVVQANKRGMLPLQYHQQRGLKFERDTGQGQTAEMGQEELVVDTEGRAAWTKERIGALVARFAHPGLDKTRTTAHAVRVSPQEFLDFTASKAGQAEIAAEAGDLREEDLRREHQTPYLRVNPNPDGTFEVVGHEGRHRMSALAKAGVKSVPIVIRFPEGTEQTFTEMQLTPQMFVPATSAKAEQFNGPAGTTIRNLVPITRSTIEQLTAEMGGEGQVLFQQMSVRLPTGKKATQNPHLEVLTMDYDVMLADKEKLAQNVEVIRAMPFLRQLPADATPEQVTEAYVQHVADNLNWLFDQMSPAERERSRKWYEGGRRFVERWAERYGISEMQAAAVIAVLSPQRNWFVNLTLAERILDTVFAARDFVWDDRMTATANRRIRPIPRPRPEGFKVRDLKEAVYGRRLADVLSNKTLAAYWIRVYDQTHNSSRLARVTPEGGVFGEWSDRIQWTKYEFAAKAVSILTNGTAENISAQLGVEAKVRSFYNNLFDPSDPRFVTLDTHAVAAGYLLPLSGSSAEVEQVWGGSGSATSKQTGLLGLYPIMQEAYRRVAMQRGMLPREIQSITWEQVRAMFTAAEKRSEAQARRVIKQVRAQVEAGKLTQEEAKERIEKAEASSLNRQAAQIWARYAAGEIEAATARTQLVQAFGGFEELFWLGAAKDLELGATYVGKSAQAAQTLDEGKKRNPTRVMVEAKPDADPALLAQWEKLTPQQRQAATQLVIDRVVQAVLREFGVAGTTVLQRGGWEGASESSIALLLERGANAAAIAATLGDLLHQNGMFVMSEQPGLGLQAGGAVKITLPAGYTVEQIDALYDLLWTIQLPDGTHPVIGHSTVDGTMLIGVDKARQGISAEELIELIGQKLEAHPDNLKGQVVDLHLRLLERGKDYANAARTADQSGRPGSPVEGRGDRLRSEVAAAYEAAFAAAGQRQLAQLGRPGGEPLRTGALQPAAVYGTAQPGSSSVVGVHYSQQPRTSLSGEFYGTGLRGGERHRVAGDPVLSKRIHFYVDTGQGITAEIGTGLEPHVVRLDNVYDTDLDPLGLKAAALKLRDAGDAEWANKMERSIVEAGFDGMFIPRAQGSQGVVALIGPRHTEVPVEQLREVSAPKQRGRYLPDLRLALMKEGANFSTVMHEMSHYYMQVLFETNDPDVQTLLDWFGVKDRAAWDALSFEKQERHMEAFAYSFEVWLSEGVAPSKKLEGLFGKIRTWMLRVYESIVRELNTIYRGRFGIDLPFLTPEVKAVFGRMLAAEEAVQRAEHEQAMLPMFQTRAQFMAAGFTLEQWNAYQEAADDAHEAAVTDINKASMKQLAWLKAATSRIFRNLKRKNEKIRAETEATARKAVESETLYRTMAVLREAAGEGKLNLDAVREFIAGQLEQAARAEGQPGGESFVAAALKKLGVGRHGMLAKDGVHPSLVAKQLGFSSGEEMIRALVEARPFEEEVELRTANQLFLEHGDLNDPKVLDEMVRQALHNEARARFISIELAALDRVRRPTAVTVATARMAARALLEQRALRNISPAVFERAETRAAREADAASRAGDIQTALKAKRRQLLNNQLVRAAQDAQEEVKTTIDGFRKLFKPDKRIAKQRDLAIVQAARMILARFKLAPATAEEKARTYIGEIRTFDPTLATELEQLVNKEVSRAPVDDYRQLTLEEFRVLAAGIESLWYRATRDHMIEVAGKEMEVDEAVALLLPKLQKPVPPRTRAPGWWERATKTALGTRANLTFVEHYLRHLDGGTHGDFMRLLFDELEMALSDYRIEAGVHIKTLVEMVRTLKLQRGEIEAPTLGPKGYVFGNANGGFGMAELLGMLLHLGNQSNKEKMAVAGRGPETPWAVVLPDGTVDTTMLDRTISDLVRRGVLKREHFEFAQKVWDLMEKIKPTLQRAHRELTFRVFKSVEAKPFSITYPDGGTVEYRGGYVPAAPDRDLLPATRVPQSLQEQENEFVRQLPAAPSGFTKERIESYRKRPLALDVNMIAAHIDEALRYAHAQPRIRDILRILMHDEFADAINRVDPTAVNEIFLPYLERAASQSLYDRGINKLADWFWKFVRRNTGVALMMAAPVSALQQVTGLLPAMVYVKQRFLWNAATRYIRHRGDNIKLIFEKSKFMKERLQSQVFGLREDLQELLRDTSTLAQVQAFTVKYGYFAQRFMQNQVDAITWLGAFDQAMSKPLEGETADQHQRRAVIEADSAVRLSQGTADPETSAAVLKGTPWHRAWMQFATYFLNVLNILLYNKGHRVQATLLAFTLPMIVSEAIAKALWGNWDDDEDDGFVHDLFAVFVGSQIRGAAAMVPGWGPAAVNLIDGVFSDRGYGDRIVAAPSMSVMIRSLTGLLYAVKAMADEDKDLTGRNVRDTLNVINIMTGLPTSVVGRPLSYLIDVLEDRVEPSSMVDLFRGLATGKASTGTRQ